MHDEAKPSGIADHGRVVSAPSASGSEQAERASDPVASGVAGASRGAEFESQGRRATLDVANFASRLAFDDIPDEVIERAKLNILDSIGCALYGQTLPLARIVERALCIDVSGPDVAIWGSRRRSDPATASLINGTMVHSFELDDVHHVAILHPGGVTLPAVLALAERGLAPGRELLVAHIAGMEVCSRVGLAAGPSTLNRGWHNYGAIGIFGAAVGAARILGLSEVQTRHTMGIAGSLASGLMAAQYGSMVKRMHGGQAAHNGVKAAVLAHEGFTGISHIFDSGYGNYLPSFADTWKTEEISRDLGSRWETLSVGHKRFASCGSTHSTIDVLLDLRSRHGFEASSVERVRITCSSSNLSHVGWPYEPDTVTTAQMNLHYGAAVALVDGDCFVDQFATERLADPRVLALVDKIVIEADPDIDSRGRSHRQEVTVEVDLDDSRTLRGHAVSPRGSAHSPFTADEFIDKFLRLSGHLLPQDAGEKIVDAVMSLSTPSSCTTNLTDLLSNEKGARS